MLHRIVITVAMLALTSSAKKRKLLELNDAEEHERQRRQSKEKHDPNFDSYRANMQKTSPDQNVVGDSFVALLRIPTTGASLLGALVRPTSHGCSCDFQRCNCQTNSIVPQLGFSCAKMDCLESCIAEGCFSMWSHAPHADWLELQNAFLRERIPRKNALVFTMLRDPTVRVITEYLWVMQRAPNSCKKAAGARARRYGTDFAVPCTANMTLAQFIENQGVQRRVFNRQTRMLAGVADFKDEELYDSPEEMLSAAKRNLAEMSWFGIYERWVDSLWLLEYQSEALNIDFEINKEAFNTAVQESKKPIKALRKERIDIIGRGINSLDQELYNFAKNLFKRRLAAAKGGNPVLRQIVQLSAIPRYEPFAKCVSGLCAKSPMDSYEGIRSRFPPDKEQLDPGLYWQGNYLDEVHFGDSLITSDEGCILKKRQHANLFGTYSSFDRTGGCVLHSDWFRKNMYFVNKSEPYFFSTRSEYPFEKLHEGNYIVAIGDSSTMGVFSNRSYLSYLEHALDMPTIAVAYGNVGASFYMNLLNETQSTLISRVLRDVLAGARVVIVQAMRVQAEGNSKCEAQCGTTFCSDGTHFDEKMHTLDEATRLAAVKESQRKWLSSHKELLKAAFNLKRPSVARSVVFLEFPIEAEDDSDAHQYPQYITDNMTTTIEKTLKNLASAAESEGIFLSVRNDGSGGSWFIPVPRLSCRDKLGTTLISEKEKQRDAFKKTQGVCDASNIWKNGFCRIFDAFPYPPYPLHWKTGIKLFNKLVHEVQSASVPLQDEATDPILDGPGQNTNFFMLLTKGSATVDRRVPLVSAETACKNNPFSTFYVYIKEDASIGVSPSFSRVLSKGNCTLHVLPFDHTTFFLGTPLDSWMNGSGHKAAKGRYWKTHQTDLFRSAILWKYGGWYLDTDVLFLRPVSQLHNCLAFESNLTRIVNNAISNFNRRHPVLLATMKHFSRTYNPNNWLGAGPGPISDVLGTWQPTNCAGPGCVMVLPIETFFPMGISDPIFEPNMTRAGVSRAVGDAYAMHLWNSRTAKLTATPESVFSQLYQENCITCTLTRSQGEESSQEN